MFSFFYDFESDFKSDFESDFESDFHFFFFLQFEVRTMWGLVLLLHGVSAMSDPLLSEETKTRRTLSRFKIDNPDNQICWERSVDR